MKHGPNTTKNTVVLTGLVSVSILAMSARLSATDAQKQVEVKREIGRVSSQLDRKKRDATYLNTLVSQLEKELGSISKKQYQTEQDIEKALARVQEASRRKADLDVSLTQQRKALAQQLEAMYTAGEQSHLRLLLQEDNPSDISRNLRYFEYMNSYRTRRIKTIHKTLAEVREVTAAKLEEEQKLQGLRTELKAQKAETESRLQARADALRELEADISGQQSRLNKLVREEAKLQRRIEALQREEERKRLAREAAERKARETAERKAREASEALAANSASRAPAPRAAQQPVPRPTPAPAGRPVPTGLSPNKPFSTLKGKLAWPVQGRLIHGFGSRRNEKQLWRGVVIAAPGGSKVRAVASGRVIFSKFMEGYGYLLILEHDRNYISLYGYNRAVFKREGQSVNANEVVAAVGNSGGRDRDALYFEIRHKNSPENPARWLR